YVDAGGTYWGVLAYWTVPAVSDVRPARPGGLRRLGQPLREHHRSRSGTTVVAGQEPYAWWEIYPRTRSRSQPQSVPVISCSARCNAPVTHTLSGSRRDPQLD